MLKARQSQNHFSSRHFFQEANKQIGLYYNDTSGRLVFVLFLEEIQDTKKTFREMTVKKFIVIKNNFKDDPNWKELFVTSDS